MRGNTFGERIYSVPLSITVYPKKYAHGFCFAVLCCGYTLTDFPISIRLTSLALWQSNDYPSASKATLMNMDKYFMWIHYERLNNHDKAKHNKTVCIFLGIYCTVFLWCRKDKTVIEKLLKYKRMNCVALHFCDRHSCVLSAGVEYHNIVIKFTNYCPVYAMFLNYTLCLNSHPWNVTITISFTILYCTYFPSPNPGLYQLRHLSWGLTCRLSNFIY